MNSIDRAILPFGFGGLGQNRELAIDVAVLDTEHSNWAEDSSDYFDKSSFWWAVVTITTVGYGDYYPVTTIGRIIAVLVMFSGIGIVVAMLGSPRRQQLLDLKNSVLTGNMSC